MQTHKALENALRLGRFTGDPKKIKKHWGKDWKTTFGPAYAFMMQQMEKRVKNFSGEHPIWAWNNKPDLRSNEWKNWSNGPWLLFSFEVPDSRVMLSNFGLYHTILMDGNLSLTEAEDKKLDKKKLSRIEKEKTWEKIFDLSLPTNKIQERWIGKKSSQELQACVDNIYISEIVDVIKWRV
jgi:hypothetical protein